VAGIWAGELTGELIGMLIILTGNGWHMGGKLTGTLTGTGWHMNRRIDW